MRPASATLSRPMRRTLRLLLPVGLVAVLALVVAACGGDDNEVPGNAVAKVGDVSITKDQFNHWMNVAAISTAAQSGATGDAAKVPDAPDFEACIAAKKQAAPKPAKGQPETSDAQYKEQCEQTYTQLKDSVMSFLISSQWVEQEAEERGIEVTPAQVEKELAKLKKQQFPKDADYQKFLKQQGMTNEDVLFRLRLQQLETKLREAVTKGKDKVTDAQITAYYEKNKSRFATPETRDARIVLAKTEAKANEAKQALDGGESWAAVAKQYSTDEASKNTGGQLKGIAKGQQEKAFDDALFGAKKGAIVGPVKTQFGWYVFEVEKVNAADQQTLEQSKDTIKQLLASEGQQNALNTFVKDFQKQWKGETDCREGFATQECKNAPKTTSTSPTGAAQPTTTTPAG